MCSPWSYHNGGSWPTLLWQVAFPSLLTRYLPFPIIILKFWSFLLHYICQLTLACIKMGRHDLAERAVSLAEKRLSNDKWPEYYDTRSGRFIGKQSRLYQTWTIAGFLTSKMLLENPEMASILTCDEDLELLEGCACCLSKSARIKCSRLAARSQVLV